MALTIPPEPTRYGYDVPPPGYRAKWVTFVDERRHIDARLQLAHTNGASKEGSIEASWNWAERRTVNGKATTLPHFQLDRDGDSAMFLPLDRQPIANARANPFSIAYETADTGTTIDPSISPFTGAQMQMLATGFAYCSLVCKIDLAYPTTWDGNGTASHTEPFGYPYWSSYKGKICPGARKKAQVLDLVIPHARAIVAAWTGQPEPQPEPPPALEEDDMPALLIQDATSGALAVTDLAMTQKRYLYLDDANALLGTGNYGKAFVKIRSDVFAGIPGEATVDIRGDSVGNV
jgi:hypothetical protein